MFNDDEKYNGHIPHIKYLPTDAIEHSGMAGEVHHVSDNVARNMDFSEPLETTAFRYGKNNDEHEPSVQLSNGHHRLAAAKQIGVPYLPVTVHARNAKGHKLNALKALSDEIEGRIHKEDGGGITAYHGSPHDFDQFDTSKIGTGEGAQAYGHGLYFAEHEPIAQSYRDKFQKTDIVSLKNRKMYKSHGNDWPAAVETIMRGYYNTPKNKENYRQQLLREGPPVAHMYEVHIDAHPDHFLDWDKPLNEQSGHVQTALKPFSQHLHQAAQDMFDGKPEDLTGADLYHWFSGEHEHGFGSEKNTSNALHQMGIKGVKYLDAGSRNTVNNYGGAGTRNYVVFDDKLVNVKRKYEQGGAIGYGDGGVIPHDNPRRAENLAAWHGGSHPETLNPDGTPRVFYHGTSGDFSVFNPEHRSRSVRSIFVSHTPEFANQFATEDFSGKKEKNANIMPVYVHTHNPFDYRNDYHVDGVLKSLLRNKDFMDDHREDFDDYAKGIASGHWHYIEDPWVQDAIKYRHDGFFAQGNGQRFLSVFDPRQIKSATGNNGNFDPNERDITKTDGGAVGYADGGETQDRVQEMSDFADKFGGEEIVSPLTGTRMGVRPQSHKQFLSMMDIKPEPAPEQHPRVHDEYIEPPHEKTLLERAEEYIPSKEQIREFAEHLPSAEENIDYLKNKAKDAWHGISDFVVPSAYESGGVARNQKPMYSSKIVEHVLNKVSAPPPALDPIMVAKRGRPY